MLDKLRAIEKVVEEYLIDLMTKRVMSMSTGVQASSTRGLPTSPSISSGVIPSRPYDEKKTEHRDDLVNDKLILTILPIYIPPLSSVVNRDSMRRDFEYTFVTTYLPKGIRVVQADQDNIVALKFSDFNLEDCKVYNMLAPHKYLT
jgi:hypothetical protein